MAASQALSTALFCEQWSCTVSLSHQVDGRKKKLNVIVCVCTHDAQGHHVSVTFVFTFSGVRNSPADIGNNTLRCITQSV